MYRKQILETSFEIRKYTASGLWIVAEIGCDPYYLSI